MMSRYWGLVSLLLILSCSVSPALGERRQGKGGLEYEVLRCMDECDNTDIQEYLLCQRDCELWYEPERRGGEEEEQYGRRRMDPRWQPGRGGGERIPERAPESEYEYERCLRRCRSEGPGGRGREGRWQHCEDQCEELRRARERRRDWEREREILVNNGRTASSTSEPEGGLEQCLTLCELHPGGQQRQLCRFRCQQRWRRQGGAGKERAIGSILDGVGLL